MKWVSFSPVPERPLQYGWKLSFATPPCHWDRVIIIVVVVGCTPPLTIIGCNYPSPKYIAHSAIISLADFEWPLLAPQPTDLHFKHRSGRLQIAIFPNQASKRKSAARRAPCALDAARRGAVAARAARWAPDAKRRASMRLWTACESFMDRLRSV